MTVRVLHLIGSLRLGGAQIVLKQIAEHSDPNQFEHFIYPLRSKHQDIELSATVIKNNYFNYDPRKFFDILRICKQHNIDILHAHLHKDILGALVGTYFQNIPVVVHEHGAIFQPGVQYRTYRILLRLLKNRASGFIAPSKKTARQLTTAAGVNPSAIRVIYNAVDTTVFCPDADARMRIRQQCGFSDHHFVIGFVGRLSRDKGADLLIEAMGLLQSENPAARLLVVGNGPMEKFLREKTRSLRIAESVHFAGYQRRPAEWINAMDMACLPSRYESFGLAAAEMMAMKVPLICTAVGGLEELTNGGENAFVLRENTAAHIASAIYLLMADQSLREKFRQNAFAFSRQFSTESHINAVQQIYVDMVKT